MFFTYAVFAFLVTLVFYVRYRTVWRRGPGGRTVGFFHPHASAGGGGERVLWVMIEALMSCNNQRHPSLRSRYVIYHSLPLPASWPKLAATVREQFGVNIVGECEIVGVSGTHLVDPTRYPRLTMVRQAIGSIQLAWECLTLLCPDYFVDTTGFPFSYPLARMAGCKIIAYTHYPTISTDMLRLVSSQTTSTNNSDAIAKSKILTFLKQAYYTIFAAGYYVCGKCVAVSMVNSTWTHSHIQTLWRRADVHRVYPPTPVEHLTQIPLEATPRKRQIVSVAQFRPEKQHDMQLRIFAIIHARVPDATMVLVGGVRNDADRARVVSLQKLATQLGVSDRVVWDLNAPYARLLGHLKESLVGLHTMRDEHFGISVVEYMAAGCVVVAHNSAGPKMDIVVPTPQCGFLATTEVEYATAIIAVLTNEDPLLVKGIQKAGRARCGRFANQSFIAEIQRLLSPML